MKKFTSNNITFWIKIVCFMLVQSVRTIEKNEVNYDKHFGRVVHVSALFRHGDRAPIVTYPRDPYQNFSWPPNGWAQLNRVGMQRAFKLGKWFRKRYDYLASEISSHTNISMLSSYKERAIMSAQCFLAAFYRPKKNETIEKNLLWQPTPIYTLPFSHDRLIGNKENCPRKDELRAKYYASKKVRKLYDKYARVIGYLRKHSGYELSRNDIKNASSDISHLHSALFIEREYGLKLPTWTKKIFPEPLRKINNELHYQDGKFEKMQRLEAGPLLLSIKSNMERKINGTSRTIFNLYSGHDTIIGYLMSALGIYNKIVPPYSAAIIFELREKRQEKIITIFYANSTETSPHFLQMPNCKSPCTFQKFALAINRKIPTDWETECRVNKNIR